MRRLSASPGWNLALATLAFALCFTAWSLIAPFAKTFKHDLGLNYTEALLLTAVPVILGSLLRIPLGVLTDRFGGRIVFSGLLAFAAIPAVLFGYADGYAQLIAVGFLLGVAGSSFAVGVPFVAGWYAKERQGFALGVYGIGNIGTAIAFFGAPAIADRWGRSAVGWVTAVALLVGAWIFFSAARNAPRKAPSTRYREVLRAGWRLYRLAFFYFITFGGFVAMAFLLPTLLQDWFDYSKGEASARAAGFIIAATAARPVGGWLGDRVGAYPVLVIVFAGIAIDAAVLAAIAPSPRIVPVTIACLSLGTFLGAGNGAVFKLVPAEFPNDAGAAGGIVGAAGGLGGFFPPVFVGLVKDAEGTYTYGFVGLLVFVGACLALAVWLLRNAPAAELRGVPHGGLSSVSDPLLGRRRFFGGGSKSGGWSALARDGREWESFYRGRWQHDRVVRSTHGVNCTGSCSWKIHVKDGIVAWETQQTDYPTNGPDVPEYEPRGCPRGASFSWYVYSPLRVRYPYVRGVLLELYREALARTGDPVEAWADVVDDPERSRRYKSLRGKGGFVRASWDEVADLIAAAHVHTIRRYGPDRVAGFSPIPAMSMVSYAAGTRFLSLIGGVCLSFYDWYADLPPASPQIWGDQTDVPESADWWSAGYVILWGSNIPQTRTPDAHFMTEARYRGQKVVVVSPDFAGHTKFADHWLPATAGSDGALAMAMGHVILKELYVDRQVPYFERYARENTDLPFLVTLRGRDGVHVGDRFLRASDLGDTSENADWKTVVLDAASGEAAVPNGSIGFRWGEEGMGKWNLELGAVEPALTLLGRHDELVEVELPRFDVGDSESGGSHRRGVPAKRIGGHLVTTVFDLLAAQLGVRRDGLPGEWPAGYDDPAPYTPAWQLEHTGVAPSRVIRVAREFARNAERTDGRSMIVMGAGTNHWYHSDQIYRAMLNLVLLCGCQGVNGGGWAHYVGQEKVRPITGWSTLAFALDWNRPPRQQATTPFWFLMSDQWRYQRTRAGEYASAVGRGTLKEMHLADCNALAARLGWMPSYPTFDRNSLELADAAEAEGLAVPDYVVRELKSGRLRFAAEDPDAPGNYPRVLTLWRANLLGSSSKGHEYFLRHVLGVPDAAIRNSEAGEEFHPQEVVWREEAPTGKLDLFTTIDFRMNGSALYSDVVLPAATWYEKHDLSSTDLHPFVHSFNPAIPPPWETKSDFDVFKRIAESFTRLAATHLGRRRDVVATPLLHDTPDELAQPLGRVLDWKAGECDPVPGKTMPKLVVVERDYGAVLEKWQALGPLVEELGTAAKGIAWKPLPEVEELRRRNGERAGRPSLERDVHWCEAILALSGVTNGRLAEEGFRALEQRAGVPLADLAAETADVRIAFGDTQVQPRKVIASPEWSGLESRDRRYSPFTINVERRVPWRTLTGRQQFYVDHEWMLEFGEGLPVYRPPIDVLRHVGEQFSGDPGRAEVHVRWLSPHSKWSIHSEFQDNLHMLTLFRGGPVTWLSVADAETIGVRDNDWVEVFNRNGVIACRAVVSHRVPAGVALMYHSQDRHVNVPRSELSGTRGGTDNSVTRISIKPTLLIGGYAQLSYGFNYYGPTGPQRDELAVVRKLYKVEY